MRKSSLLMTVVAASLITSAALAQTPPAGGAMMGGAGRGGMYTQQEQAMLFLDHKGMTDAQIADMRTKQRAMTDADRTKQKADLDVRWAKLSPSAQADAMNAMQASFQGRGGPGGGAGRPAQ